MTKREMRRPRGMCGITVHQPKSEVNVGTLWRSAFLYDVNFIATIGKRYRRQSSDTPGTPNHVPLFEYVDIEDFKEHLPVGCVMVGVEMDDRAISLNKFSHPMNVCYVLGAEDRGLPPKVLDACHRIVQIPTVRPWSLNLAVAGSILLNHRYAQRMS